MGRGISNSSADFPFRVICEHHQLLHDRFGLSVADNRLPYGSLGGSYGFKRDGPGRQPRATNLEIATTGVRNWAHAHSGIQVADWRYERARDPETETLSQIRRS